jgi:hypothetical protein
MTQKNLRWQGLVLGAVSFVFAAACGESGAGLTPGGAGEGPTSGGDTGGDPQAPATGSDEGGATGTPGTPGTPVGPDGGSASTVPIPGLARAWGLHDGEKIAKDELTSSLAASNVAWDGKKVKLFGARNEVLGFQIVVESTAAGIKGLSVALPSLHQRGGAATITYAPPVADPTAYAGRPIQVFVENYMNVTQPTHASWVFDTGSAAAPKNPTGWKPVQLVPENARAGKGGLPIDVAPRTNQAFWIDVHTARNLPPGIYDGSVRLSAGGSWRDIPIELELFDFVLPDEASMKAMVYFEPEQVSLYQGQQNLEDRFHRFAHRQRIELVNAYDAASLQAHAGRFNGTDFSAASGYAGPGEGVGNRIAPASFYGPGTQYDVRASAWQASDAWMTALAANAPGATTFLYMPDEPSSADYPRIKTIAGNIDSNPGPGKGLPIFVTHGFTSELASAIDIWCTGPSRFDVAVAASERAKGKQYWFYNGKRPASGAIIIDAPATDPRVTAWAAFKDSVEVFFYWHGDHWQHNRQKVNGDRLQNVWADPITFDNRVQPTDDGVINGDGVLFYPGQEVIHPAEDRGIAGPVSTIQLANLRRGLQDHQYLTLARKRGLTTEVNQALTTIVPKVFSDASGAVAFPEHGDAYEQVRHALGLAIAAAK